MRLLPTVTLGLGPHRPAQGSDASMLRLDHAEGEGRNPRHTRPEKPGSSHRVDARSCRDDVIPAGIRSVTDGGRRRA
jgi:hypothetical protein